jgi:hypothetical protein
VEPPSVILGWCDRAGTLPGVEYPPAAWLRLRSAGEPGVRAPSGDLVSLGIDAVALVEAVDRPCAADLRARPAHRRNAHGAVVDRLVSVRV